VAAGSHRGPFWPRRAQSEWEFQPVFRGHALARGLHLHPPMQALLTIVVTALFVAALALVG
jgi:hypothetical protein